MQARGIRPTVCFRVRCSFSHAHAHYNMQFCLITSAQRQRRRRRVFLFLFWIARLKQKRKKETHRVGGVVVVVGEQLYARVLYATRCTKKKVFFSRQMLAYAGSCYCDRPNYNKKKTENGAQRRPNIRCASAGACRRRRLCRRILFQCERHFVLCRWPDCCWWLCGNVIVPSTHTHTNRHTHVIISTDRCALLL